MSSEAILIISPLALIFVIALIADWDRRTSGEPSLLLLLLFLVALPLAGIGAALTIEGYPPGALLALGAGAAIVAGLLIDRSSWLRPLLGMLLALSIPITMTGGSF